MLRAVRPLSGQYRRSFSLSLKEQVSILRDRRPSDFPMARRSFHAGHAVAQAMPERAVLLDIDATLVYSNDSHAAAWQQALAAEGQALNRAQIHGL